MSFYSPVKYIILLFLICILGFAFRIYRLDSRSIWLDETFSLFEPTGHGAEIDILLNSEKKANLFLPAKEYKSFLQNDTNKSLKDVAAGLLETDTHPPLYFFIMHFWIRYFGDTLFSIRFLSVLLGVASIICAFLFTSAAFDKKAGLFAAILVAFSPFAIFYSQEARHYSLILALTLLSSYFFIRLTRDEKNSLPIGFTITSALGLYTHYFYIFIFLGYLAYFMFSSSSVTKKDKFYTAFFASLLLFYPWVLAVLINGYNFERTQWVFGYKATIGIVINWIIKNFSSFFITIDGPNKILGVLNYLVIICLIFLAKALLETKKELIFCAIIIFLPIFSMAAIDLLERGYLLKHPRYYTFSFAGLIPAVGYMLSSNWKKKIFRPIIIFIFALLLINSFFVVKGYAYRSVSLPRPKNAFLWINQQRLDKKIVVIMKSTRENVMPDVFYLDDDIIVVPVGSPEQLKDTIEQFKGKADTVFAIHNIFESNILKGLSEENMISWLKDAGYSGFNKQEKIEFREDNINVFKLN